MSSAISRRTLVAMSLAGGGAIATGCGGHSSAHSSTASGVQKPTGYFADPALNFQTLFALGSAGYGISEVGEVLAAVARVNSKGPSYQTFYDEFWALGRQLAEQADAAVAKGHRVSARSQYLRAAEYYSQALYFVLGTSRPTRSQEKQVYAAMQQSWNRATQLFPTPFERVQIPWGSATLPGYLLRPDASGQARPTVILNNGSDAQNVDLYAFGGAAALERGYNALIFEGPGQGSLLFERNIPFVPDWEHVVRPVVDLLQSRRDVEKNRIAIVGWSFCGASVARAAAYDHRLAAVVLDPGVTSVTAAYHLGKLQRSIDAGQKQRVNQAWAAFLAKQPFSTRFTVAKRGEIYGKPDFYDQVRYMEQFNLSSATLAQIKAPTLVMEAQEEQFYPGQSALVYAQLHGSKTLAKFTAAQGAQFHDEPMAPQTRNEVMYDWLDDKLGV